MGDDKESRAYIFCKDADAYSIWLWCFQCDVFEECIDAEWVYQAGGCDF